MVIQRFSRALGALLLVASALCPVTPLTAQTAPTETAPQAGSAAEGERHLQELLLQAETWRGLRAKRPVPSRTLAEKALSTVVTESFHKDMPAGTLLAMQTALKTFGLIPESLDLSEFLPRLLTEQIAGYYDPETKALSLVRREGGVLGGHESEAGLDAQGVEDMILIHELTHALQDQSFDLAAFVKTDPMSDESTARQSLVEGDATLTMLNAFMGVPVEELPGAKGLLEATLGASGTWRIEGSGELLAEAPPFLRETLLFSYAQGSLFCVSVRQKGGQKLLDHAFTKDPPRSSEQILHPEKWHGRRDDPVVVEWPDLAGVLPGFAKVAEGEMGEIAVRILLRETLKNEERATVAAAGWGGDRFAVYEKKGRRLLAWITEWDSAEDAAEFATAAQQLGPDWRTERPAAQRVIVLRGELAPQQARPLRERLAKATARHPANREIDLAALGIREEDRASEDPEKLKELLQNPGVRKRLGELADRARPAEAPEGVLEAEGRSYTSPAFSIRLPESAVTAGWTLVESPSPPTVVVAEDSGSSAWIGFGQQALPDAGTELKDMLPMVEGGFRAMIPGYKPLGSKTVETANGSSYEVLFDSGAGGESARRGLLRIYKRGSAMVYAMGMADAESWQATEPHLRSVFDAVVLAPEKASQP